MKKGFIFLCLQLICVAAYPQRSMLDSLQKLLTTDLHDTTRVLVLIRLANGYVTAFPDTALMYCDEALFDIRNKNLGKFAPAVWGAAGNAYIVKGDYDKAEPYFRKVIKEALHRRDYKLLTGGYNSLGILFLYTSNYDSAIIYFKRQLTLASGAEKSSVTANVYNNIAIAYFYQGNYPLSLQYQLKGLHERELQTPVNELAIANSLLNIGEVYAKMQDYPKSLEYYHRARHMANGKGDNDLDANIDASIGKSHYLMKAIDSAFYYQLHSMEIYKRAGIKTGIASNSHHLALLYKEKKDWGEALKQETTALGIFQQLGNKRGIAESYQVLAEINLMLGQSNKAKTLALQGLRLTEEIKEKEVQKNILKLLSQIAEKLNDFQGALSYWNRFDALKDSLFSASKTREMANMEALYENDKKNGEIEILQQKAAVQNLIIGQEKLTRNIIIGGAVVLVIILLLLWNRYRIKQRSNAALEKLSASLQKSLGEKELLLKEIHHRVKNNLQVISSLLSLQSRSQTDSKVIEAMKEGQSRVKSMALIHQKLYQNEDISSINFLDYTRELLDYLFKTYQNSSKSIQCRVEPFDLKLDVDTAVPLGLIMNELISNSLKYAFNNVEEGLIDISMKTLEEEGRMRLTIRDNGVGMPENFDQEKSTSIGLRLVKSLAKQLQAELTILDNKGLSYYIDFKIALN